MNKIFPENQVKKFIIVFIMGGLSSSVFIYFLLPFFMPIETGELSNWLFSRQVNLGLIKDVNHQDKNGETLLIRAVRSGNGNIVSSLLFRYKYDKPIDINILDRNYFSALNYSRYSIDITKMLVGYCINKNCKINLPNYKLALRESIQSKDSTRFLLLLTLNKKVVNLSKNDIDDFLGISLEDLSYDKVERLIQEGANVNSFHDCRVVLEISDPRKEETLLTCIFKLYVDSRNHQDDRMRIINLLVNKHADINKCNATGCSPLMVISRPDYNYSVKINNYYEDRMKLLSILIENKVDINLKTEKSIAIRYRLPSTSKNGFDFGGDFIVRDVPAGSTALTFAIHSYGIYRSVNDLEYVSKLIESGAEVNFTDSDGNTPIDIAKFYPRATSYCNTPCCKIERVAAR